MREPLKPKQPGTYSALENRDELAHDPSDARICPPGHPQHEFVKRPRRATIGEAENAVAQPDDRPALLAARRPGDEGRVVVDDSTPTALRICAHSAVPLAGVPGT
jgi:hypothetical protein